MRYFKFPSIVVITWNVVYKPYKMQQWVEYIIFFNLKHRPLIQAYKFIQHILSMQSMKKSIIVMFYLDDENI